MRNIGASRRLHDSTAHRRLVTRFFFKKLFRGDAKMTKVKKAEESRSEELDRSSNGVTKIQLEETPSNGIPTIKLEDCVIVPRRPTVGDLVTVLSTPHTRAELKEIIGVTRNIREDAKDYQPFRLQGHPGFLYVSDVELANPVSEEKILEDVSADVSTGSIPLKEEDSAARLRQDAGGDAHRNEEEGDDIKLVVSELEPKKPPATDELVRQDADLMDFFKQLTASVEETLKSAGKDLRKEANDWRNKR